MMVPSVHTFTIAILLALGGAACGRLRFDGENPDAVTGPCSQPHTFCDQFDREGNVDDGWDGVVAPSPTTVRLSSSNSVSAPNSLQVDFADLRAGALTKRLGSWQSLIRIEFDLAVQLGGPPDAEIDVLQLDWDVVPPNCLGWGFYLVRASTGELAFQETYLNCPGVTYNPLTSIDDGRFHHVVFTISGVSNTQVVVVVDGTTYFSGSPMQTPQLSSLTLHFGAPNLIGVNAPSTVWLDNLTVDIE